MVISLPGEDFNVCSSVFSLHFHLFLSFSPNCSKLSDSSLEDNVLLWFSVFRVPAREKLLEERFKNAQLRA